MTTSLAGEMYQHCLGEPIPNLSRGEKRAWYTVFTHASGSLITTYYSATRKTMTKNGSDLHFKVISALQSERVHHPRAVASTLQDDQCRWNELKS